MIKFYANMHPLQKRRYLKTFLGGRTDEILATEQPISEASQIPELSALVMSKTQTSTIFPLLQS